jgi:hypothetical protein
MDEETLGIVMRDKKSGAFMRSTVEEPGAADNPTWRGLYGSGVTMEYIVGTNLNPTRASFSNMEKDVMFYYRNDGFSAEVYFPVPQISYTLHVALTDYGFSAEIPQSSIKEGDPNIVTGAFFVYPFLGHSVLGADEGYMFIPDGQGALIELKDNERRFSQPFMGLVYGTNIGLEVDVSMFSFGGYSYVNEPEQILMPCFGMVHTEKGIGFLGVIESGAENARIEAWPNGASTQFDWVTAKFTYRHVFMQPMGQNSGSMQSRTPRPNRVDIKLRFIFVTGEEADYAGLAVKYREYLEETGAFRSSANDPYRTCIDFFGSEKKEWALFKLNVNMTTFKQAENILKDLNESGVNGVFARYDGWQRGGASLGLPTRGFNPAGNLGGRRALMNLIKTAEDLGGEMRLSVNPLDVYVDSNPLEALNSMKRVTGRTIEMYYGSLRFLTPSRSVEVAQKTADAFAKNGIKADISGITRLLTGFSENNAYYDRTDNAALYGKAVAAFDEPPALTKPFAYLWQYASALTYMPAGGSGYLYVWREIPFLSIAASGKIPVYFEHTNFQSNRNEFFLKLVETGARPMFLITAEDSSLLRYTNSNHIYSSYYDLYKGQIIDCHNELTALHARIGSSGIVGHWAEGKSTVVTYDNGLKIYLNYDSAPRVIDGVSVPPMSYVLGGDGR